MFERLLPMHIDARDGGQGLEEEWIVHSEFGESHDSESDDTALSVGSPSIWGIDVRVERVDGQSPPVPTLYLCRNAQLGRFGDSETVEFDELSQTIYLVMRVKLRKNPD